MRESKNGGELVVNMLQTGKGSHILFPEFGLEQIDESSVLTRTKVQNEVSRWYPDLIVKSILCTSANEKGEFEYDIDVEG